MKDLPFTVYDFFAYLASGFVLLWFFRYAFDLPWFAAAPSGLVLLQWIIAAYITGHVVAHLAAAVLEGTVVRRWLRRDEATIFADLPGWRTRCFPGFFRPLAATTMERVLARASKAGITTPGEGLFYHCLGVVKNDATAFSRMNTFLNLYGFARNVCMACLLGTAALALGAARPFLHDSAPDYEKQLLIIPSLLVAVVLFYRYLKFLRQYSLELYVTFATQEWRDNPAGCG